MATARIRIETPEVLPRSATIYAVQQLARRAGVTSEFLEKWRVEFDDPGWVTVCILPGTYKRIRFPRTTSQYWSRIQSGTLPTTTAQWMKDPGKIGKLVPDFKIPFSSAGQKKIGALFHSSAPDCVDCALDLPASTLLTLSRFEETIEHPRDEHGRFPAKASIAWRDGFLHRPIVDEYGFAFSEAIEKLMPGWEPTRKALRVKIGHDVDEIGLPFSLRTSVAHTLRRRRPLATFRDLLAPAAGIPTSYQVMLRKLVELSMERGFCPAVYWKFSRQGPYDAGYNPNDPRIASLISTFRLLGIEMGVHPSYASFESTEQFHEEVAAVRGILGEDYIGGRQDFLRWRPSTWIEWEALGLAYDASVGYADHIGFRAGTCHPYRPWLMSECREANLLEIPLIAMDATLLGYMKLDPDAVITTLREYLAICAAVGGVFTLLWHNTTFMEPRHATTYRALLDQLQTCENYDFRTADDENG